jgi:hypothetical protein
MSDNEKVVAHFTPQVEGAFLRNVPRRDLTQADVDAIAPGDYRDAFEPHPAYGTPLYTWVEGKAKTAQEKATKAAEKDDDA